MKGRVVFWFTLDEFVSTGIVFFKLFGQRCQSCSPQTFEHAMWYPEEVLKVSDNLSNITHCPAYYITVTIPDILFFQAFCL